MTARWLLAACALLASLAAVEVVLRVLDRPRFDACDATADYAVGDPELGFRGDPSRPVAGVTPNALGLRGPLPAHPRPENERRLLFLGDSTVWGLGVELHETFGARVAAALGPDARFVLGAFPSYSSYHSRVLVDRLLPLVAPDRAVLYLGARNDADRARYYPDADIPARRARLEAAWHRLHVLRGLEGLLDRGARIARRLRDADDRARVPPADFRANVAAILAALEDRGVPALVVVPPLSQRFDEREPLARRYRELLLDVAREHGAPVARVPENERGHTPDALFAADGFHLSRAGHAAVARAVRVALAGERG